MIAVAAVLSALMGAEQPPSTTEAANIRHRFRELHECISRQAKARARQELGSKQIAELGDADKAARLALVDCKEKRARLIALPVIPYAFGSMEELDRLVHGLALDDARGELKIRVEPPLVTD